MNEKQAKHSRDLATVSHAVIKFLGLVFTTAAKHSAALRANEFAQSSPAQPCRPQLICLSKYRMCQRATAVNQTPSSPVFNTANNTLNGLDVYGVQGPAL
jgi:hypothetical protein